jgi:hypothetical protein
MGKELTRFKDKAKKESEKIMGSIDKPDLSIENIKKAMGISMEDPTQWGDGPWVDEPLGKEPVEMSYKGYDCAFVRNLVMGHWCGYVGVSVKESELAEKNDNCLHGGITYTKVCNLVDNEHPSNQHILDKKGSEMIIGFDCAHAEDIMPRGRIINDTMYGDKYPFDKYFDEMYKPTYKTLQFCKDNVREFIDELIALKDNNEEK